MSIEDREDPRPLPPEPHECCGGGSCCPCVWDRYYEALRQWQRRQGDELERSSEPADADAGRYR